MPNNDELNPLEEIKNGEAPPPAAPAPPAAPTPPPEPEKEQPKATEPPKVPTPPSGEPGKKAIIKRSAGEGSWLKYLLLAFVVLALGAMAFYYFFYQVTFDIAPTPTPDKILIDNREVKPGVYRVKPGVHTINIEKAGYISYLAARKYSIGEKVVLHFEFKPEQSPSISSQNGRLPSFSTDKRYLFFLDRNSQIAVIDLTNQRAQPSAMSNGTFPSARILNIAKDTSYALLLDSEAIKVVNFNRSDLINQSEKKLPPLATAIHSLTWNDNASTYFPEANSRILYDLQSTAGWDIYLSDISHSQADIIMQIDPKVFPNLYLDWGTNPNQVLIAGGELGILDISKRDYQKIATDKQFAWAKWSPDAKRAIAVDYDGGVWELKDNKLTRLPFDSGSRLVDFADATTIAAVSSKRPIKYNFDSGELINYAEVKGLSESLSFITKSDIFYFETASGIYNGRFEKPSY